MDRSLIFVVILTRFRKTTGRVAAWLLSTRYESLFINLPEEVSPFVKRYMAGEIAQEAVWRSYSYVTGLSEPFINALRYAVTPLLTMLPKLRKRRPGVKVYCYQDFEAHLEAGRLAERLLLLETGERLRRRIRIGPWRTLLRDEVRFTAREVERIGENLAETASSSVRSAVLYGGSVPPLKRYLEERGFTMKPIYVQPYWRSPLDGLRTLVRLRGIDEVSDACIRTCVTDQLTYLNYVLTAANIDAAHDQWTFATRPHVPKRSKAVMIFLGFKGS